MKTFSQNYKPIIVWYGLLTKLSSIIVASNALQVYSNINEVPYLPWQSKYPKMKNTCHNKPKLFLWTKLAILLLAKYLVSVAATLNSKYTGLLSKLSWFHSLYDITQFENIVKYFGVILLYSSLPGH